MTKGDAKKVVLGAFVCVLVGVVMFLSAHGAIRTMGIALTTLGAASIGGAQWLIEEETEGG